MDRQHDDGLRRTWQQYAAELTLQQLQSEPNDVFHHLQRFPQHVVQRGLEATSLAQCTDMHERIANFLPAPQPPPSTFHTLVKQDVCLLQEKIIKTYVVSKIADKIYQDSWWREPPCQVYLNGGADPMMTWMHEVQAELEPLKCVDFAWRFEGQVDGIIHIWSFCDGSCTEMLLDVLRVLGFQATT